MSTPEGTPPGVPAGAPAAIVPPPPAPDAAGVQAPPAAPLATLPASDADTVRMSSAALKKRLEDEAATAQRKLLKELGVEKPEDLKTALASLKTLQEEKLSAEERTQKRLADLTEKASAGEKHATLAKKAVDTLFATLPEDQQKAIDEMANGDAGERLRLIEFARRLGPAATTTAAPGASPAGAPPLANQPPAAPPLPASPATTAPPAGAPRPSAVKTKYDEYQDLQKTDPNRATVFLMLHERAIKASTPAAVA